MKRLRSYLQISRFLSELAAPKKKKKPKKGRKKKPAKKTKSVKQDPKAERQEETQNMLRAALSKFLQPLGLQLDSKGVYFKYLHIHLTLIARRIGLRDFSELMELIYFVIQPDEGRWFGQLYQQCQEVLTGVKEEVYIDDREIIARLASLGFDKPKENPRLLLLAHLFTSTQRGESIFYKVVEELQANERYDINLSEEDIIQRVELMLPAYDVLDRGQLFARIGLNEEIMDTIQLRLTAGDLPTVHFSTTRQTSGVWNAIFGIMEEEELELIDFDDGLRDAGDKSDKDILCLLSFVPPRNFIRSTIRRFLAAIAETKHVIKNSVVLSGGGREDILITAKVIAARNRVKILQIITDLFKKENLDCGLDISTVGSVAEIVVKRAPEDMNLNLLEDILKNNLETERLSYAELTVEKYDRSGAGRQKITPPTAVASSV